MKSWSELVPKIPANYSQLSAPQKRRVREHYVRIQKGLCMYCKKPLNEPPVEDKRIKWWLFPPGFRDYPVHLQHNHKTDKIEGAVHAYCNAVLWQYHGR